MSIDSEISTAIWRKACAASIASLSGMNPKRLLALLSDLAPEAALEALIERKLFPNEFLQACGHKREQLLQLWSNTLRSTDPLEVLDRYQRFDIGVWSQLDEYPVALDEDPHPPAVLFWQGSTSALKHSKVAIIGTRNCTYEGRSIARRFAAELSEAGVSVVSGLALGIDGAAHKGALSVAVGAPSIAVVGSGLDVVYPKRNGDLWHQLKKKGLLISEAPLGAQPEPWRFPARNRIIAGLADLVLVIESHESGGSLLTVNEASERGVPVMAVPGSINNPAARGSNALIADGCAPACSTLDVLDALSMSDSYELDQAEDQDDLPDDPIQLHVLQAVDWQPTSTEEILLRTDRSLAEVATALSVLEEEGWIVGSGGWWQRAPDE